LPRPEKEAIVAELEERLSESDGVFVTEYRGLTVAELADLRRSLREKSAEFKVVRNTLTKLALERVGQRDLTDLFEGPTAVAFYAGDPVVVAKALRDFSQDHPSLVIKGGTLASSVLGADDVDRLAKIEPREVLLGKTAGALKAPLFRVASAVQGVLQRAAYVFGARLEQLGGEGTITGDVEAAGESATPSEASTPGEDSSHDEGD
jgi:large subunit ribosomal protein L10